MVGKRIGIVIGNNYPNSNKELKFAVADAEKIKGILENKDICGFDEVYYFPDKESREVSIVVDRILRKADNDLVFIYYSGHGKKDHEGKLCLLFNDTDEDAFVATSLSFDFIQKCIKYPNRKSVVIVLDCCYSCVAGLRDGDADVTDELKKISGSGIVVLASTGSTGSSKAREDEKLGHGIFTYYLIEGLEKGTADTDKDGYISIDELYAYAYKKTTENSTQSPKREGRLEGTIQIGKNPLKIRENEYELKKEKLLDEYSNFFPSDIFGECLSILRKFYKNPSCLETGDKVILGFLECLLKDDILPEKLDDTIENCIEAIQHKKKKEKLEREHRQEDKKDKRAEQEKLLRQKEEIEKLEENLRKTPEEIDGRKKEQDIIQQEELCRQIKESEQKQVEENKKKNTENLERIKINESLTYPHERINEIGQLEYEFLLIRDKQLEMSNFLHLAINDENYYIRYEALNALDSGFSIISDKQRAFDDLIKRLINDQHNEVGYSADDVLISAFSQIPDKEKAWNELYKLATHEDYFLRYNAICIIGSLFSQLPNKERAWNVLHKAADDNESLVRSGFLFALEDAFTHIKDKKQVCEDLHKLTNDQSKQEKDLDIRSHVASTLCFLFGQLLDKEQAWSDLHRLTYDSNRDVRSRVISSIGSVFTNITEKEQAWNDFHRLTTDKDYYVRGGAAEAIGAAFQYLPDKQQAWEDLHKLIHDENYNVREDAAEAIGAAFQYLPDKQQAWDDLHKLTYDDSEYCEYIFWSVASAIGAAFSHLPDKEQAWRDLYRLATCECCEAREKAIEVLGSAFIHMQFKQRAFNDLYELIKYAGEEESDITTYAYQSLGNISLFKASQSRNIEDYKKELEQAIEFFKEAGQTNWCENPAEFNLYLFRALHTMLFNKQEANEDLNRHLGCIKSTTQYLRADKCKKLLCEAIENLATAFKQVQYLENKNFKATESELKFYRKYFDHSEELLRNTEEKLSVVTGVIRTGMAFLDKDIKRILNNHLIMR